jgi:hypothetical protein
MKSYTEHLQIVNTFHELGETIAAAVLDRRIRTYTPKL